IMRPYRPADLGNRIRVIWKNAESRGRGRNAVWNGAASLRGNAFKSARSINFWNAEKPLRHVAADRLEWESFTTGSFSGFDAVLADCRAGVLHIETVSLNCDIEVGRIGYQELVFEAGGLGKRIRAFRLPDENPHRGMTFKRRLAVRPAGDTRPHICVTQEDGHRAWSSPLYLFTARAE